MPIKFFLNQNGSFTEAANQFINNENTTGWWSSLHKTDYDGDGDEDFIIGNIGLNHKFKASPEKPFHVYCEDFDKNGSMDVVLAKYADGKQVPVRGRECSSQQMPFVAQDFPTYNAFADATVEDLYASRGLGNALHYEAKMFQSIVLENENGRYVIKPLPQVAQLGPVNGIVTADFDGNGSPGIVVAGNMYHTEVETTRADASLGLLFGLGQNKKWNVTPQTKSGLNLYTDVKDVEMVHIGKNGKGGLVLVVASNDEQVQVLKPRTGLGGGGGQTAKK